MGVASILRIGLQDVTESIKQKDHWLYLGIQDIKKRYRRSVLGPWWLTISTGILVGTLGILWSAVFKTDVHSYMPFFSTGLVIWIFISGLLTESCNTFMQFEGLIKQRSTPFFIYILRVYVQQFIILLHNFIIVVIVLYLVGDGFPIGSAFLLPGLILISLCLLFISAPIAIFCARFRDMPQVVTSFVQIAFYMTPILWSPNTLDSYKWVISFNPFHAIVSLFREPLLEGRLSIYGVSFVVGLLIFFSFISFYMLGRYKSRIAYWL